MVEVQTHNLPPDLFDTDEDEDVAEDLEWEEKMRKVKRAHERWFDDE